MTRYFYEFLDEGKPWVNGLNVFMACHAYILSLRLKSCINGNQRHCVDTEKSLCTQANSLPTQGFLCVDTGSSHVVSAIPK